MKRTPIYSGAPLEDPSTHRLETYTSIPDLQAVLVRRLLKSPDPFLTVPYLIHGAVELQHPTLTPREKVQPIAVHWRPRITVLPDTVRRDCFHLRTWTPATWTVEEHEPGRWRIEERDLEHVETFRVTLDKAWRVREFGVGQGDDYRQEGFEELQIQLEPDCWVRIIDSDDDPVPTCWAWLRISLEPEDANVRSEEQELMQLAALL